MLEEDVILQGILEQIQSQKTQSNSKQWSMVTIRDSARNPTSTNYDCSVFPPVNHENLQISSHHNQQHPSSKSPSSSLSLSPPSDFGTRDLSSTSKEVVGWLDSGLELLRTKICSLFSLFTNDRASKGASWSFGPVAGVAVVVMWWWLCMRIRRRRSQRETVEHLKLIIKEKDEVGFNLVYQSGVCENAYHNRYYYHSLIQLLINQTENPSTPASNCSTERSACGPPQSPGFEAAQLMSYGSRLEFI